MRHKIELNNIDFETRIWLAGSYTKTEDKTLEMIVNPIDGIRFVFQDKKIGTTIYCTDVKTAMEYYNEAGRLIKEMLL